jgi:hypothetical protein
MTLREVVRILESGSYPDDPAGLLTIFVQRGGEPNSDSQALLVPQSEDGSVDCPTDPRFTYLLEVSVAAELLQDLRSSRGAELSLDESVAAVLGYAANDSV